MPLPGSKTLYPSVSRRSFGSISHSREHPTRTKSLVPYTSQPSSPPRSRLRKVVTDEELGPLHASVQRERETPRGHFYRQLIEWPFSTTTEDVSSDDPWCHHRRCIDYGYRRSIEETRVGSVKYRVTTRKDTLIRGKKTKWHNYI